MSIDLEGCFTSGIEQEMLYLGAFLQELAVESDFPFS